MKQVTKTSVATRSAKTMIIVGADLKQDDEDDPVEDERPEGDDDKENPKAVVAMIALPSILPVSAFIVVTLMEAYTSDVGHLCLAAIKAIRDRATLAGEDRLRSVNARRAAYVPIWLWRNHATERSKSQPGKSKGVGLSQAVSREADMWASSLHRRYLVDNAGERTPPQQEPAGPRGPESIGTDVWANLANALVALQATAARSTATPVTKKGFDAFPITTQQMILFASERAAGGGARAAPVDIYTEILGLGLLP